MIRLFVNDLLTHNTVILLDYKQKHYLKNVMRKKISDEICVFNGLDGLWIANISKSYDLIIDKMIEQQSFETQNIILFFALIKRQDIVIEKATELGVTTIVPIISERTIVRKFSLERAKKISIESCEQSHRLNIPQISELISIKDMINQYTSSIDKFILSDIEGETINNKMIDNRDDNIGIIIGPEGGFTPKEKEYFESIDIKKVSFSKNTLRAETAAICAISCISNLY